MGALLSSRQRNGVEEVDVVPNHAYKYPPRSGKNVLIGAFRFVEIALNWLRRLTVILIVVCMWTSCILTTLVIIMVERVFLSHYFWFQCETQLNKLIKKVKHFIKYSWDIEDCKLLIIVCSRSTILNKLCTHTHTSIAFTCVNIYI